MRHAPLSVILCASAVLLSSPPQAAFASTAVVPDDYPTIQEALDSAPDTVLVGAGSYSGDLTIGRISVIRAEPDLPEKPRLTGLRIVVERWDVVRASVIRFEGLHFTGPVSFETREMGGFVSFYRCQIDAGLDYSLAGSNHDITTFHVAECGIVGDTRLFGAGLVEVRGNRIRNGVVTAVTDDGEVLFNDNVVEGGGLGCTSSTGSAVATGNHITAGDLLVEPSKSCTVRDNDITGPGRGLQAGGRPGIVERNTVRRSQALVASGDVLVAADNRVFDCEYGLITSAEYTAGIRGNVVAHCAHEGLRGSFPPEYGDFVITENTIVANGGSGIVIESDPGVQANARIRNNLVYGNDGHGLELRAGSLGSPPRCNDWFRNVLGPATGVEPGASDLAVDPIFCDLGAGDFTLRSDSPLLAGDCAPIGALGLGCDVSTEVLVVLLTAERASDGVRIVWRLGGDEAPRDAWIERATSEAGPWRRIATDRTQRDEATVDRDGSPEAVGRSWYRLAWTAATGSGASSMIEAPRALGVRASYALRVLGPNPTSGPASIEYALPHAGSIALVVHDLMGREVARLASGSMASGVHRAQWTGEAGGGRATPGLYFVRLRHSEGELSQRILVRR
jgi:hypothetical protein